MFKSEFFARGGNVNDQHPYLTTPNINTQKHLHQSGFYISYTSLISIFLRQVSPESSDKFR